MESIPFKEHSHYFFLYEEAKKDPKHNTPQETLFEKSTFVYKGIDGLVRYRPMQLAIEDDKKGKTNTFVKANEEINMLESTRVNSNGPNIQCRQMFGNCSLMAMSYP